MRAEILLKGEAKRGTKFAAPTERHTAQHGTSKGGRGKGYPVVSAGGREVVRESKDEHPIVPPHFALMSSTRRLVCPSLISKSLPRGASLEL